MTRPRCIGVLLSLKKRSKTPLSGLSERCPSALEIIYLDGHNWREYLVDNHAVVFDLFIHKLADFFVETPSDASVWFVGYREAVEHARKEGRIVRLLDGFEGIGTLQNRIEMLRAIEFLSIGSLSIPSWGERLSKEMVYPVIAKPIDACGSPSSHTMQLLSAPQDVIDSGHIYQTFIPHHQLLYKIYVIGSHVDIVVRGSISADLFLHQTEFEYGVTVGKAQCTSALLSSALFRLDPFMNDLYAFIDNIRMQFALTLFGVDVIIGEADNRPYIIDVNYFPGYDGVPDFPDKFISALQ